MLALRRFLPVVLIVYKLSRLVTEGPYSLTCNPLYVFSAIATFGVGAQLGSVIFALLCATATIAIFLLVVGHEARALADLIGLRPAGLRNQFELPTPRFHKWLRTKHDFLTDREHSNVPDSLDQIGKGYRQAMPIVPRKHLDSNKFYQSYDRQRKYWAEPG